MCPRRGVRVSARPAREPGALLGAGRVAASGERTLSGARVLSLLTALAALAGLVASVEAWRGDLAGAELMHPSARTLADERYVELLDVALAKNPSATVPLGPAARGLAERRLEEHARRANDEALRRNAPFEARLLHAADLAGGGRLREAAEVFEALHRVAPADRTAVQYLLGLHTSLGDARRLEEVATESERLWPGGFDALVVLKNLALARGDRRRAMVLLRAAVLSRDFPEPRLYDPETEKAALRALEAGPR